MQEDNNTLAFGAELNKNLKFPTINENPEFPTMLDELNGIASYLKWSEDAPTISESNSKDDYLPRGKVRDYFCDVIGYCQTFWNLLKQDSGFRLCLILWLLFGNPGHQFNNDALIFVFSVGKPNFRRYQTKFY